MSNFKNLLNFLHLDLLLSLLFPFTTGADAPLHGFLLDHFHCRPCLTMNQSRIIQGFPFKSPFPLFSLFLANPSDPKCLQLLIFRPGRELLTAGAEPGALHRSQATLRAMGSSFISPRDTDGNRARIQNFHKLLAFSFPSKVPIVFNSNLPLSFFFSPQDLIYWVNNEQIFVSVSFASFNFCLPLAHITAHESSVSCRECPAVDGSRERNTGGAGAAAQTSCNIW